MRSGIIVTLASLFVCVLCSQGAVGQEKLNPAKYRGRLTLSGKKTPYYRTDPLNKANRRVERLIIVIHGTNRNADTYFANMVNSVHLSGELDRTAIIAPQFQTLEDTPHDDEYYWSNGGWKQGDYSTSQTGFRRVSSFGVIAMLLNKVKSPESPFPNLRSVVLIGHSAGGQFLNRFAARMPLEAHERIIVLNPGTYLYLDDRRIARDGSFKSIEQPAEKYNDYRFGLDGLKGTMSAVDKDTLKEIMMTNRVYYVAGTADTKADKHLPSDYASMLQGKNRFERWQIYGQYAREFPEWGRNVEFYQVPGVGHSSKQMFHSPIVRKLMFSPPVRSTVEDKEPAMVQARRLETFFKQTP